MSTGAKAGGERGEATDRYFLHEMEQRGSHILQVRDAFEKRAVLQVTGKSCGGLESARKVAKILHTLLAQGETEDLVKKVKEMFYQGSWTPDAFVPSLIDQHLR